MPNNFENIKFVTYKALEQTVNNSKLIKLVNTSYADLFAKKNSKYGDTIYIRLESDFTTTKGNVLGLNDIKEKSIPLKIDEQHNTGFTYTSVEGTLNVNSLDGKIKRIGQRLGNLVDVAIAKQAIKIANTVGSTTDLSRDIEVYLEAKTMLDNEGVALDDERYVVIGSKTESALVAKNHALFNSQSEISKQNLTGRMYRNSGFNFAMDQNVYTHVTGSGVDSTLVVKGASQSGSSVIVTGLDAGKVLKAGDTITFTDVYAVNDLSKQSVGYLRQFVITKDVTGTGSTADTVLNISPALTPSGAEQNVTNSPANNAPVVFYAAVPNTSLEYGLAFHKDAITLACVELELPSASVNAKRATDPFTGLSIRCTEDFDIVNDKSIYRFDILFGVEVICSWKAVKIVSNNKGAIKQ